MPIDYQRKYQNFIDTKNGVLESHDLGEFIEYRDEDYVDWTPYRWDDIVRDALRYDDGWYFGDFRRDIFVTLTIVTKEQIKRFPSEWKAFNFHKNGIRLHFEMDNFKFKKISHVENKQKTHLWEYTLKYECFDYKIVEVYDIERYWKDPPGYYEP